MAEQNQPPKIQIDDDWKAQARAEKDRMAAQAKAASTPASTGPAGSPAGAGATAAAGAAGARAGRGAQAGMPPANYETLVSTMATQALYAMGAFPDPRTGQRVAHLDLARHHIDMLGVIEEKTKNNLSEQEATLFSSTLYELRQRYIQVAMAARERQ